MSICNNNTISCYYYQYCKRPKRTRGCMVAVKLLVLLLMNAVAVDCCIFVLLYCCNVVLNCCIVAWQFRVVCCCCCRCCCCCSCAWCWEVCIWTITSVHTRVTLLGTKNCASWSVSCPSPVTTQTRAWVGSEIVRVCKDWWLACDLHAAHKQTSVMQQVRALEHHSQLLGVASGTNKANAYNGAYIKYESKPGWNARTAIGWDCNY